MDQAETKALPLRAAYLFGEEHGLAEQIDKIRNMVIAWDRSYTTTLRRSFIVDLLQEKQIFEEFKTRHWNFGNSRAGNSKLRLYKKIKEDYKIYVDQTNDRDQAALENAEEEISGSSFALESHLRDFLAKNMSSIEGGLKLFDNGGRSGVEYVVDNGRIDILAIDSSENFVVIELKVGRGRSKVIGQLLYYMGWVDENLGKDQGKHCRGMIIADDIHNDLRLAVARVPGVSLFSYNLSFKLDKAN